MNSHSYEQSFIYTRDEYSYMYIQCIFWPYSYQKRQKFFPYVKHKEKKLALLCKVCYNRAKPKERRYLPCITMHPLHHFTTLKRSPTMSMCAVCACAVPGRCGCELGWKLLKLLLVGAGAASFPVAFVLWWFGIV